MNTATAILGSGRYASSRSLAGAWTLSMILFASICAKYHWTIGRSTSPSRLASPWFKRRWVVQEVFYKSTKVSLLLNGWLYDRAKFHYQLSTKRLSWKHLAGPLDYTFGSLVQKDLLQNLYRYSYAQCLDPRDRVFALIGISTDGHHIPIDYDLDILSLYFLVARHYIELGLVARIFAHAAALNTQANASDSWPSWVPDWRHYGFDKALSDEEIVHPCLLAESRTASELVKTEATVIVCDLYDVKHSILQLEVCILQAFDVDRHDSEDSWPCERRYSINELEDIYHDDPLLRNLASVYRPCPRCRLQTAFGSMDGKGIVCFLPGSSCLFSFTPASGSVYSLDQEFRVDSCWADVVRWDGGDSLGYDIDEDTWKSLPPEFLQWQTINIVWLESGPTTSASSWHRLLKPEAHLGHYAPHGWMVQQQLYKRSISRLVNILGMPAESSSY